MMFRKEPDYPRAVILHTGGVDPSKVAGLPDIPRSTLSFTDTHPVKNPHNANLGAAVAGADHVFVQNTVDQASADFNYLKAVLPGIEITLFEYGAEGEV